MNNTNVAIEKLNRRMDAVNSLLCVGLDPDFERIPAEFLASPTPQFAFNKKIIDETQEFVCAFKPNMAFYEARGEAGALELKLTMEYLHAHYPDIFLIADAKRADIGPTNKGYAKGIFDYYGFDAITLQPYPGREALEPFLTRTEKASIILCRTSNPGAGEFQDLETAGQPLWATVAQHVSQDWNAAGNYMLVVGATYPRELARVREIVGEMTLLVPGVGVQGGSIAEIMKVGLNAAGKGMIISTSREVIFAEASAQRARELRDEIRSAGTEASVCKTK